MNPRAWASATTEEKGRPAPVLKMYDREPLNTPSILRTRSPVARSVWRVAMTGSPAPTVA